MAASAENLPSLKAQNVANHFSTQVNIGSILSHRYEQLLYNEKYTDCAFHIGNNQIKAHKIILAAASPVFEAMFFGPMQETGPNIDILDMSLESFKVLVQYIYTGKALFENLDLETTIELYYGAEKYLLNDLIDECLYGVTQKLRFSNILPALELSFCMNLSKLLEICMNFFTTCCLCDFHFVSFLKKHYCHISKDCLKQIIDSNKKLDLPNLLWFVIEWCEQEREENENENCDRLWEDLQLPEKLLENPRMMPQNQLQQLQLQQLNANHIVVERCYYKACRPITIDWDMNEWKMQLKCNRFICVKGVLLHSRLPPSSLLSGWGSPLDYKESLNIEIKALDNPNSNRNPTNEARPEDGALSPDPSNQEDYVNPHFACSIKKQLTKYNSNLMINWPDHLVLSPDLIYEMKITWDQDAYGAEYPCSLMSSKVEGIQFIDSEEVGVSILKGLRIINLV